MAITKQSFYMGAAIYLLARSGNIASISFEAPFFIFNRDVFVLLKYSTRGRSPWAFTITPDEQIALSSIQDVYNARIALICGSDGVATIKSHELHSLISSELINYHLACYRGHGGYYSVRGPRCDLSRKVPPSDWQNILSAEAQS